ncbi:MAG: hypothetical protein ACI91G_001443 [Gammaproteobacteria bacterium]|jgi:hypothetical protein
MKKIVSFKFQALAATASLGLVYAGGASAFLFDVGDVAWRVDTAFTSGISVRTEEQNQGLIGIQNGGTLTSVNSDDGNLNFEKGDIVSAALKLTTDISAQGARHGFSARTRLLYDPIYDDGKPLKAGRPALPKETQDRAGADFQLAEAYFVTNFDIAGHDTLLKAGRVVLNWGESTFTPGGVNIDPADLQNLRAPGAKIRDAFTGSEMLNVYVDINENLGFEGFYQFGHNETEPDPQGTFFSTLDIENSLALRFGASPEGDPDFTIFRSPDNEPRSGGQAGMALRYYLDAAGGVQLAAYYANYHSRAPLISGTAKNGPPNTMRYFLEYPEDNQLLGVSANGIVGDWSIYGELAHHIGSPLQVDDVELIYAGLGGADQLDADPNTPGTQQFAPGAYIRGYERLDVSQVTFGGLRSYGSDSLFWADNLIVAFEVGMNQVHDMPTEDELRFDGPGTTTKGGTDTLGASPNQQVDGFATDFSWGYKLIARMSYFGVTDSISLIPRAVFFHDVDGVTPGPTVTFVEDRKSVTLGLTTQFSRTFDIDFSYSNFFGGGNFNNRNDRDHASLTVAYSF